MFGEIDYSLLNSPGSPYHFSRVLTGAAPSDFQQYSQPSPALNWRYHSFDFLSNNLNIMPNNDTNFLNSTISNNSLNSDDMSSADGDAPDHLLYLIIPLYSLVFVIGTIGNILVILTVVTVKQMRNTTNALILHLAIANLSFVLMCIPHTIYIYVVHSYYFPRLLCKLTNTLMYLSAYVSIYILVLMSIDRFLGVVFAVKSVKYRTERNAHLAVIIVWLIGIIFASPNMIYYDVLLVESDIWVCLFRVEKSFMDTARLVTAYFFALFGLIVPLVLIAILYGLLINVLRKNAKGKQVAKGKKRVTKMVSAVISSFVICWTPMQIYLLYVHHDNKVGYLFAIVAQSLVYISSCINPILYAFLSEPFRKAFKQFLTCSRAASNNLSNLNGNETMITSKTSSYSAVPRQSNKALPLKSTLNHHRNTLEVNVRLTSADPIKYDLVLNTKTPT